MPLIDTTREYRLVPFEMEVITAYAKKAAESAVHQRDFKMGAQSDEESKWFGFGAELAFARLFNVCMDLDPRPQSDTADFVLPSGALVDVKCIMPGGREMLVGTNKTPDVCDLYVFMQAMRGLRGRFRYLGYVPVGECHRRSNLGDMGHGATYVVPFELLRTRPVTEWAP